MITIEWMSKEDIPGVLEVEKSSFSTPWSENSFYEELNNPLAHYLVAKDNEKVVGYMGYWHIVDEGHITNVAVHSDYRRQGIGHLLVESVLLYIKESNIQRMTLEVRESNKGAIHLYESFGFRALGRRKDYYDSPKEDAVIYWLEVDREQ